MHFAFLSPFHVTPTTTALRFSSPASWSTLAPPQEWATASKRSRNTITPLPNIGFPANSNNDHSTSTSYSTSYVVMTAAAPSPHSQIGAPGKEQKLGVLLLNLGGPEKQEDVEGFLFNLFNDPDIIRLPEGLAPLQTFIASRISRSRAPKSRAAYETIGGGSPIVRITKEQAAQIQARLSSKGVSHAKVYVGMRYWHPFTEEAMDQIRKDGVDKLVILPLYPQYSISTSGSSLRVLHSIFTKDLAYWNPYNVDHTVIPVWYQRQGYLNAMKKLIQNEIDKVPVEQYSRTKIMFSAHGVPESYIDAGDPYKKHIEDCCQKIMDKIDAKIDWLLCYQSRVGPIKWLQPYTDDVLRQLGEKKETDNLIVVPISFVSEHIETLEEIDGEYRELAHEVGIPNFLRVPALDTNPDFIDDLADSIIEAVQAPSLRVNEAMALTAGTSAVEQNPKLTWKLGFNRTAEALNGRIAMLALAAMGSLHMIDVQSFLNALNMIPK